MTQTYADLANGIGSAANGQGTIGDALESAQSKTVQTLESQGLQASE